MELVDALTGALIEEPVRAADGHVYDRRSLTAFFEQRRAAGQPTVSPQDLETPMGTELREAPGAQTLREARGLRDKLYALCFGSNRRPTGVVCACHSLVAS